MRKAMTLGILSIVALVLTSCAGTQMSREIVPEEPQPGMSAVVGAILIENMGMDDYYRPIKRAINVVVVGKSTVNGEEKTQGYRVYTDENGYFMLQNVPPGSYVVKGCEFTIGISTTMRVTAEWEANRKVFRITDQELNYIVRSWPPESDAKVINTDIHYFLVDRTPRIVGSQVFSAIDNQSLGLQEYTYTMKSPVDYFKEKFPDSGWFQ